MQAIAPSISSADAATPAELRSSTASNDGRCDSESENTQNFTTVFGTALSQSPDTSASTQPSRSLTPNKRPGEPDKTVPSRSKARMLAGEGADLGLTVTQIVEKPTLSGQIPPPDLSSSTPSGSPKASTPSALLDRPTGGGKRPSHGTHSEAAHSSSTAPKIVSDGASEHVRSVRTPSKAEEVPVSLRASESESSQATEDGRPLGRDRAGISSPATSSADYDLSGLSRDATQTATSLKNPTNAESLRNHLGSADEPGASKHTNGARRVALEAETADGVNGSHAADFGESGAKEPISAVSHATDERRGTNTATAAIKKISPSESSADAKRIGEKSAASDAAATDSAESLQGIQTGVASQPTPSAAIQSIDISGSNQVNFDNLRLNKQFKDIQDSKLNIFTDIPGEANPGRGAMSSWVPTNAPNIQVAVAAQVIQEATVADSQTRVALLRIENDGLAARGVVRQGSESVWASLLTSSEEAASLAQTQVPYLRQTIASLGFTAGDISVSVNPDGVNREQGGPGSGGKELSAAKRPAAEPGKIFTTEEVG
jgi:hypothetical protein